VLATQTESWKQDQLYVAWLEAGTH
jgi:hypothetical protein